MAVGHKPAGTASGPAQLRPPLGGYRRPLGASGYTAAISKLGHSNDWLDALELWNGGAKASGFGHDEIIGSAVVAACSAAKRWTQALALLGQLRSATVELGAIAYNSGLTGCARGAAWPDGLALLSRMKGLGVELQVVSFNAAAALCRAPGRWAQGAALLQEARCRGFRPTAVSYNTLLSINDKSGTWASALAVLQSFRLFGVQSDCTTLNSALSCCEKGGRWELALEILQKAAASGSLQDEVTLNSVTSSCGRSGHWTLALSVLALACCRGIRVGAIMCTAAASGCDTGGHWAQALLLCASLRDRGIAADVELRGVEVSALGRGGLWEVAAQVFTELRRGLRDGLRADVVLGGATISAYERGGQWEHAVCTLACLRREGIEPNDVTLGAAIAACKKGEQWRQALGLLPKLHQIAVDSRLAMCNAAVSACSASGRWARALALLSEVRCCSAEPDVLTLSAAASACGGAQGHWGWAVTLLLGGRSGVVLDRAALGTLVCAFCFGRHWQGALRLLAQAQGTSLQPDAVSLSEAVRACVENDALVAAAALLADVRGRRTLGSFLVQHAACSVELFNRSFAAVVHRPVAVSHCDHGPAPKHSFKAQELGAGLLGHLKIHQKLAGSAASAGFVGEAASRSVFPLESPVVRPEIGSPASALASAQFVSWDSFTPQPTSNPAESEVGSLKRIATDGVDGQLRTIRARVALEPGLAAKKAPPLTGPVAAFAAQAAAAAARRHKR
ncbi:unnamed protein product [Polarella glacialis]|uniref:Pentatricopeptide repeat-containing protein, chloroplastic n=1 Tax=Polarella glacialis TaxID=89957 RepID=A0A813GJ77_POLGL|nr:unnamed protein product [Polarella glacialis]